MPVPDEQSAPYWQAAAEHVLRRGAVLGVRSAHPSPGLVCPHCGSTEPEFDFTPVRGRGVGRSWTVVRQSFLPGFDGDVPFVLVDVELVEQTTCGSSADSSTRPERHSAGRRRGRWRSRTSRPACAVPAFVLEAGK